MFLRLQPAEEGPGEFVNPEVPGPRERLGKSGVRAWGDALSLDPLVALGGWPLVLGYSEDRWSR